MLAIRNIGKKLRKFIKNFWYIFDTFQFFAKNSSPCGKIFEASFSSIFLSDDVVLSRCSNSQIHAFYAKVTIMRTISTNLRKNPLCYWWFSYYNSLKFFLSKENKFNTKKYCPSKFWSHTFSHYTYPLHLPPSHLPIELSIVEHQQLVYLKIKFWITFRKNLPISNLTNYFLTKDYKWGV